MCFLKACRAADFPPLGLALQAQIAVLQAAVEASAAKAAALKARAEQGEVAQGRLCLAAGAQGSSNASSSPAAAAPAAAASGAAQQEEGSSSATGHVALEDLGKAVAAAYQRCVQVGSAASPTCRPHLHGVATLCVSHDFGSSGVCGHGSRFLPQWLSWAAQPSASLALGMQRLYSPAATACRDGMSVDFITSVMRQL